MFVINTDGTGRKKLNDDDSDYINVAGDKIYYSNNSNNNKLYVINTDGIGNRPVDD